VSQFATASELATLLQRSFSTAETNAANLVLAGVSGAIQRHTGQQIEKVDNDDVKLAGVWTRELTLPQWPVISVSSVKVNNGPVAAGTWILAGGKLYRGTLPIFNGPDDWGGDMYLSSWLGPMATVEVVYTHGFAVIPPEVKLICMRAAWRVMSNPDGFNSETVGGYYSVTHGVEAQSTAVLSENEKKELDSFFSRTP